MNQHYHRKGIREGHDLGPKIFIGGGGKGGRLAMTLANAECLPDDYVVVVMS